MNEQGERGYSAYLPEKNNVQGPTNRSTQSIAHTH